jgi:hypothetical protein
MILTLLKYWQIGAGAVLGALIASAPVYLYGKHEGRQQAAVEAARQTVIAYQERAKTDETIKSLDAVALCVELGGLPDSCAELRGLAEDSRQTGNGGLSGGK